MSRTALIALALLAAPPVLAQDTAAMRKACREDFVANCPGVKPGGGRLVACFRERQAAFSEGCRAAMQSAQAGSKPR
ncbi:hypothetical protein AB4099_00160 [Bosea sp. 2KB_26]|uniref:hypothetical protein n=1 Tax=Bosea sp. 2KB_26 TaxID=3237475 RepID=UPI003F8EBA97